MFYHAWLVLFYGLKHVRNICIFLSVQAILENKVTCEPSRSLSTSGPAAHLHGPEEEPVLEDSLLSCSFCPLQWPGWKPCVIRDPRRALKRLVMPHRQQNLKECLLFRSKAARVLE